MKKIMKDSPLTQLWVGVNKKQLKYYIIAVILVSILLPSRVITYNEVSYTSPSAYNYIKVTKEEKVKYILEKYNLTMQQFKTVVGVTLSEAKSNSYEDAYAVINTIYNRTHAKNWVRSHGTSLYKQVIAPRQFTVYASGTYVRHMNDTNSVGYDAIIDFLYEENIMHNYLSFRSGSIKINNSVKFAEGGNNYFSELKEENRV